MTLLAPTRHAKWGASSAHRWMACPGALNLSEGRPDSDSFYAREGTLAHGIAAHLLSEGVPESSAMEATAKLLTQHGLWDEWSVAVDLPEMVGFIMEYVNTVRSDQALLGGKLLVEHEFDLSRLHDDMFGTNDAALLTDDGHLAVYDFKYGQGHAVEVEGNPQLRYYLLGGVLECMSKGIRLKTAEAVICQPRKPHVHGTVRRETVDLMDLLDWTVELVQAVERTKPADAPLKAGDWCDYCKARAICPEQLRLAQQVARVEFNDVLRPALPKPGTLTQEQLLAVLDRADEVEAWLSEVRSHLRAQLDAGKPVPGWKLVSGRASRKFNQSEEAMVRVLVDEFGLKRSELFTEPELLSVAQVEKLLKGPAKKALETYVQKFDGKPSMVRADDSRPALLPSAHRDFADFTQVAKS